MKLLNSRNTVFMAGSLACLKIITVMEIWGNSLTSKPDFPSNEMKTLFSLR